MAAWFIVCIDNNGIRMKGKIAFYGPRNWGPVFEQPYEVVGTFLFWDVGFSVESCDFYMNQALEVAEGKSPPGEGCGNGHIVRLMPTWVLIANIHLEESIPAIINMDAYLSALRYWKSLLAAWDRVNLPSNPPEFIYDNPEPNPRLSPEEAQREIQATLSHWTGYEPPHHISQLQPRPKDN